MSAAQQWWAITKSDRLATSDPVSRTTLAVWRFGQVVQPQPGLSGKVARRLHKLVDLVWTRVLIGGEFPAGATCGPGVRLEHGGRGVFIHPQASFGSDLRIFHGVTVGARLSDTPPTIGNEVFIGANASVLGAITVGDGAKIGAHAIVIHDVPAGATVVPAPSIIKT